ncbi:MAG: Uma2 family endonuclease [Pirellulales bacterium]
MSTGTRVTFAEYERMIAEGAFEPPEEHHVELIRGEIVPMSPKNPPHENIIDVLTQWSYDQADRDRYRIGVQRSVGIPVLDSEPEPDIVWFKRGDYTKQHPRPNDVLLIIEVAESSLRTDATVKAELYAEAGIDDYWVVDMAAELIAVYRHPDPQRKRYRTMQTFAGDERVSPLCQPEVELRPAGLWEK